MLTSHYLIGCHVLLATSLVFGNDVVLNRQKRFLIWPKGVSKIQAICGFGVPLELKKETVILGTVFKANYKVPTNISQIGDITYARKIRSASRWDIYKLLSSMTEMRGFGGKSCILRMICEVARHPLDKSYGLFNELVHLMFTPTSTSEYIREHGDNEYYAAQAFGMRKEECNSVFPDCTMNFADLFMIH